MSDGQSISVNFAREMPIFPLEAVVLLPQQVLPLHIFETRYRQMIGRCLDGAGQLAIAVVREGVEDTSGNPPVHPAVCVAQIVQHETLPDGRYNVLLQGVCRARIIRELPPTTDRLYRAAYLEPVGEPNPDSDHLYALREWIEAELSEGPLKQMAVAEHVVEYVRNEEVPNAAVLELVSFALLTDPALRYRLLSEGDLDERAAIVRAELADLAKLISLAESQKSRDWPKGCSWN
ncbi:MAG: LON peptidase substrate-binding domain-containing protein [Phycisphaerales bacterium]|nr:LON peptidase substrate-binding domain-containing protein [Phycisphaerales bacterium]